MEPTKLNNPSTYLYASADHRDPSRTSGAPTELEKYDRIKHA
jgi:hypothetical protein